VAYSPVTEHRTGSIGICTWPPEEEVQIRIGRCVHPKSQSYHQHWSAYALKYKNLRLDLSDGVLVVARPQESHSREAPFLARHHPAPARPTSQLRPAASPGRWREAGHAENARPDGSNCTPRQAASLTIMKLSLQPPEGGDHGGGHAELLFLAREQRLVHLHLGGAVSAAFRPAASCPTFRGSSARRSAVRGRC
jgi:hypothetical protein